MMLAWGALLNAEERGKLRDVALSIGADPSDLSACIYFESRWDPAALNAASGASGLIQFMPGPHGSAVALGTTTDAIRQMTRVEQLDLVHRYFTPYINRVRTLSDLYMAILWPRAVGKPEEYALFSADDADARAYMQNKGLDLNRDGTITKAEATSFVARRLTEGLLPQNAADSETQPAAPIEDAGRPYNPEQESPMPGVLDAVAAAAPIVGTAVGGPVGTIVGSLAGAIVQMFSANAQKKIDAEIARHDSNPEVIKAINDTLSNGVMAVAQQVTSQTDPVAAYTAVAKDPATYVPQIEHATVAKLDEIAPFLDKIAGYEAAAAAGTIESEDAAAKRSDGPPLRLLMLRYTWLALAVLFIVLAVAIVLQIIYKDDHTPTNELVLMFGTSLTYLLARVGDMTGYGFGGVLKSDAASAGVDELRQRASAR